jgi:hypothetical protein
MHARASFADKNRKEKLCLIVIRNQSERVESALVTERVLLAFVAGLLSLERMNAGVP